MEGIRKITALLLVFLTILLFAEAKQIVILHTSDLHGFIYPINYATNKPANQGIAKVATA
ncbi:MAG: hypothetical protein ACP5JS_02250 [Fervidobacterium sp.]